MSDDFNIGGVFPLESPSLTASFWGDSRTAQNFTTPNLFTPAPRAGGQYWYLEAISRRFRLDVRYNFAVVGDTIDMLWNRMVTNEKNIVGFRPLDVPPGIAFLLVGTNSLNGATSNGYSLQYLTDGVMRCVNLLRSRGHIVVVTCEWPRGGASGNDLPASDQILMVRYVDFLRNLNRLPGVHVSDVWADTADPSRTDLRPYSNVLSTDNLHGSPGVALATAMSLDRVLENDLNLPRLSQGVPSTNADQYDSTANPYGCLNTNPMLVEGTGGTLGSGASGVVPQDYTLSTTGSLAVTGSFVEIEVEGVTRPAFRMAITGTLSANNSYVQLSQTGLVSKVSPGNTIYAGQEVQVAADHTGFGAPGLVLDTGVASTTISGGISIDGYNGIPAILAREFYAVPLTGKGLVYPGISSLTLNSRIYFPKSGDVCSATVDLLCLFARKV